MALGSRPRTLGASAEEAVEASERRASKPAWSAIAAALLGWIAVGVVVAGRVRGSGILTGYGIDLFVLLLLAFGYRWWRRRRQEASPETGRKRTPGYAWLGVGIVPGFYAAVAMFDQGNDSGWALAVVAVVLLVVGTGLALGLMTDTQRRQRLDDPTGFLVGSPFVRALVGPGGRRRPGSDGRRRNVLGVESLLTFVALVLSAFTGLLVFLATHHVGVSLSGGPASTDEIKRATSAYIAWHSLDLVPLLDVPRTLNWSLTRTYTDHWSGVLLLALKLFIIVPVLGTARLLLQSSKPDRHGRRRTLARRWRVTHVTKRRPG
jgi:hypothetical protein